MSRDRTVDSLFEEYALASPVERDAELQRLCSAHPGHADELRGRVDDLLHAAAALEGMETMAREPGSDDRPVSLDEHLDLLQRARTADDYSRLDRIARGGMAVVERVWDPRLRRTVARKVLPVDARDHRHLAERERRALTRFLDEAHVQGSLGHPAVLPVFDTGVDAEGQPFFTMPIVVGEHLGTLIRRVHRPQPTSHDLDRLIEVLVRICEAIGHAHAHGVIHRDLKPQNVMVGRFGQTYVMDWGLAKVVEHSQLPRAAGDHSLELDVLRRQLSSGDAIGLLTMDGDVLGTPAYMAPEQAAGHAGSVGKLSDVYAIGAMLYEVLAGVPPYERESHSSSPAAVLDAIQRGAPPPLHEVAAVPPPPELAAVCDRAMARRADARYADVSELEADLRAFREGQVVRAFRVGAVAEFRSWVARNRALAVTALVAAVFVLGSTLTVALVSYRTSRELAQSNVRLERVNREAEKRVEELRRSRYYNDLARAQWLLASGKDYGRVPALLAGCDEDLRGWEWGHVSAVADESELSIAAHDLGAGVAWSPAGDLLATSGDLGVRLWSAATGALAGELHGLQGHPRSPVLSEDGKWVGVGTMGDELRVWSSASGEVALHVHQLRAYPKSLVYLPGDRVAAVFGSELRVYSLETEQLLAQWTVGDRGGLIAYDLDSRVLVVAGAEGVAAYDETGHPQWQRTTTPIGALQLESEGELVVACVDSEGSLQRWRASDGELVGSLVTTATEGPLALSADRRWIAVGRGTNVDLVDRQTGARVRTWSGHSANVLVLSFAPDSSALATSDADGAIKTWRVAGLPPHRIYQGFDSSAWCVAVDRSGSRAAAAEYARIAIWDTAELQPRVVVDVGFDVKSMDFSPDGARLGVTGTSREVVFFDAGTGERLETIPCVNHHADWIRHLPDGARFVVGADSSNLVRVVSFERGERGIQFRVPSRAKGVCLSPGGAEIATLGVAGRLQIWSADTGAMLRESVVPHTAGRGSAWSRDGRFLSTMAYDGGGSLIQVWRADDLTLLHELPHDIHAQGMAFGPEGRLFTMRSRLRVWDPESGTELLDLAVDVTGWARQLAISADGKVVVAGGAKVPMQAWVSGGQW